jgi:hypothetical protein
MSTVSPYAGPNIPFTEIVMNLYKPEMSTYFASNKSYYYGNKFIKPAHIYALLKFNLLFPEDLFKYPNMLDLTVSKSDFIKAIEPTIIIYGELQERYNSFFTLFKSTVVYDIQRIKKIYDDGLVDKKTINDFMLENYESLLKNSKFIDMTLMTSLSHIYTCFYPMSKIGRTLSENSTKWGKLRDKNFVKQLHTIYMNAHINEDEFFKSIRNLFPDLSFKGDNKLLIKSDKKILKSILGEDMCRRFYSDHLKNKHHFNMRGLDFSSRVLMHRLDQMENDVTTISISDIPKKCINIESGITSLVQKYASLEKMISDNIIESTCTPTRLDHHYSQLTQYIDDNCTEIKSQLSKLENKHELLDKSMLSNNTDIDKYKLSIQNSIDEITNMMNLSLYNSFEKIAAQQSLIDAMTKKITSDEAKIAKLEGQMTSLDVLESLICRVRTLESQITHVNVLETSFSSAKEQNVAKDTEIQNMKRMITLLEQKIANMNETITENDFVKIDK